MSTELDGAPAVARMRLHAAAEQTNNSNVPRANTHTIRGYAFQFMHNNAPDISPPPNMAKLPTDVAAIHWRATLSWAVDHFPVALLYKSTTLEYDVSSPPANTAMFPTDAATSIMRPTLSWAVDHDPVALLYKSTTLDTTPAMTHFRPQAVAGQPKNYKNSTTTQSIIHQIPSL